MPRSIASLRSAGADRVLVAPRRQQRRLVDQVRQIGARHARASAPPRAAGRRRRRTSRPWRAPRRIASRPALSGRSTSTCRSKRPGRISAESSVSGRLVAAMMMRPLLRVEAVHLRQQLVERLLALVVPGEVARPARLADRVELVDEDDARRLLLRLLKQVAHARRADADEHLDEVRAGEREERHVRLAGDRAREQASCRCLAGRPTARPWEFVRRVCGTSRGSTGSRRSRAARLPPRRRRRRRRR